MTIDELTDETWFKSLRGYLEIIQDRAEDAEEEASKYRSAVKQFLERIQHARSDAEVLQLITNLKRETEP